MVTPIIGIDTYMPEISVIMEAHYDHDDQKDKIKETPCRK
jgi:hypothetical protein